MSFDLDRPRRITLMNVYVYKRGEHEQPSEIDYRLKSSSMPEQTPVTDTLWHGMKGEPSGSPPFLTPLEKGLPWAGDRSPAKSCALQEREECGERHWGKALGV